MKPLKISRLILSTKLRSKTNKPLALTFNPKKDKGNRLNFEIRNSAFGSNKFYLYVGINTPNFVQVWQTQNPNTILDPKSYFILNCFSEFKVKILEQAMISFYSPQINSSTFGDSCNF